MKLNNLRCKIFGCNTDAYGSCSHCGTWVYNWEFVQIAWLDPWYRFVWWLKCNKHWFGHRCDVCKKPMVFTGKECCSEKCYDNWIPF